MHWNLRIVTLGLLIWNGASQNCPRQPLTAFYHELGCEPLQENGEKCPTSYDCFDHERRDSEKCFFEGNTYNVGDKITHRKDACVADCTCVRTVKTEKPTINCANVECPEHFGFMPRPAEGCYHIYEGDSCCSTGTSCATTNTSATCTYGNETFMLGQKFYPEDDACKVCICNAGGPVCAQLRCNVQLHSAQSINEGCVPVYYGLQGCCPIQFQCPAPNDKIVESRRGISTRTTKTCKFGHLTLQPGDMLELSDPQVSCTCSLPPYLTCFMQPHS